MIHVLTVHHRSDRWVDIQADALQRTIGEPFQVHGCLDGVPETAGKRFDSTLRLDGAHAPKLNALAAIVQETAGDDDLLMFLDGDAFPVADPMPTVRAALDAGCELVAVRRDEALEPSWPHPCFLVTTVGWWRGREWRDVSGVLDVGPVESWLPLLRVNTVNPHPQLFGLYGIDGPLVYHHGAGFRLPRLKLDVHLANVEAEQTRRERRWSGQTGSTRGRPAQIVARRVKENVALSDEWHAKAAADPEFWRELM